MQFCQNLTDVLVVVAVKDKLKQLYFAAEHCNLDITSGVKSNVVGNSCDKSELVSNENKKATNEDNLRSADIVAPTNCCWNPFKKQILNNSVPPEKRNISEKANSSNSRSASEGYGLSGKSNGMSNFELSGPSLISRSTAFKDEKGELNLALEDLEKEILASLQQYSNQENTGTPAPWQQLIIAGGIEGNMPSGGQSIRRGPHNSNRTSLLNDNNQSVVSWSVDGSNNLFSMYISGF